MSTLIPVSDGNPNATKKGLRIRVMNVRVDDEGYLETMDIEYSEYHHSGYARINTVTDLKLGE